MAPYFFVGEILGWDVKTSLPSKFTLLPLTKLWNWLRGVAG